MIIIYNINDNNIYIQYTMYIKYKNIYIYISSIFLPFGWISSELSALAALVRKDGGNSSLGGKSN
jgi:hypothetical protein